MICQTYAWSASNLMHHALCGDRAQILGQLLRGLREFCLDAAKVGPDNRESAVGSTLQYLTWALADLLEEACAPLCVLCLCRTC